MKRLGLGIIVCVALMLGGCEESFTPAQLQTLAARNEVLQQQLDKVQAVAVKIAAEIEAQGLVNEETLVKVAKINEEADRVQAQIDIIARALQGVPLTGDAAQDFIAQLQAANTVSSGFNPYVVPIGTGLTLLTMFLGWLAKRKAAEAAKNKAKYQATKHGVNKTMKEMSVSDTGKEWETKLYENIGTARRANGIV